MPMPVFEEIRRARDEDDDDQDDDKEGHFESFAGAWEHATIFPIVVTTMGKPWTIYSSGPPPWATSALDALTDGLSTSVQTTHAQSSTLKSSYIAITQPTSVPASVATELSGPGAHDSSSSPTPASTTAPGHGAAANTASSAASTSCAISTDVEGPSNGAASPSHVSGGYNGSNGGVTDQSGSNTAKPQDSSGGPPLGLILAGVIIPLLIVSLLAFTAFIVMRRRKQRKNAERALGHEEMKLHLTDDSTPPPGPTTREPPVMVQGLPPPVIREPSPQQTATVTPPPRAVTPVPAPPPVIVSAMNPANNSSYFTGIDTSEALSIRTNSVRSSGPQQRPAGFMLDGEFHEEPPPPYRPRSVPPISRDSSMRTANYRSAADCASIQLAHDNRESRSTVVINPFADPSDDNVSITEEEHMPMNPFMREEDEDRLSDVSDLSYQREPAMVHQGV